MIDLGRWWKDRYQLPLPLGALAVKRSLPEEVQAECNRLIRSSVQYALDHHEEALNYAMQFARDLDETLAEKFIGMYVNHYTLEAGPEVAQAAEMLWKLGREAGLISVDRIPAPEFV